MSLRTDIAKLKKIAPFTGGTKSERDHLNELVDAINVIRDAANNNAKEDAKEGELRFTVAANGSALRIVLKGYIP